MPTRFVVNDFDFKDLKEDNIKNVEARATARKEIRKRFT